MLETGPSLDTVIEDVYRLFDPKQNHVPSEDNLDLFCQELKQLLRQRLKAPDPREGGLRFSSLGKPDRQVYLDNRGDEKEELSPKTFFKFLYGDVIEQLLLFLVREAGHIVEDCQAEVEVDGVKGHIDARIDGVVVDVKSASPIGFQKFSMGKIFEEDHFGYVAQLSGYADVLTPDEPAAWLAMDKVSGELSLCWLPRHVIADNRPLEKIRHQKEILDGPLPPPCYSPVPDGKSGNEKLATPCSYCGHKTGCWPNARLFLYSSGPRWLTHVSRVPDVPEITK